MNEQNATLLRDLAAKLETTVEALWPKALRFIVIDAAVTLCVFLATVYALFMVARRLDAKADKEDIFPVLAACCRTLGFVIAVFAVGCNLPAILEPVGYLVTRLAR